MILLINTCKERLHYYEFVKPIEDILKLNKISFFTKHYKDIQKGDFMNASKIVICGTSLGDFDYFNNISSFFWLKDFKGAVLGICAGMQIMVHFFGRNLYDKGKKKISTKEIGMTSVNFSKNFFGFFGTIQAYELHQLGVGKERGLKNSYATSNKGIQAMKWGENKYGVLFHPEVRNKELIIEFVKNG